MRDRTVARDYFRRMRDGAFQQDPPPADQVGASEPAPDPLDLGDATPESRLSELATPAADASDERTAGHAGHSDYADWAQRMHDKRSKNQQRIAKAGDGQAWASLDDDEASSADYWTTDALYAESRRVDEEELTQNPTSVRVAELLAVLDLRDGATRDEIGDAYKRLAKAHHPDRYATADDDIQQFHADQMMTINKVYRALRQLERT